MNGKKGLIGIIVALAAVLALAGVAYGVLAPKASQQGGSTSSASSQQTSVSSATSAESFSQDLVSAYPTLSDFTVQDLEGNDATLSSMRGKPTLVGFWATWCPPCNMEAPSIQKLYEEYGDKVNFMMINVTDGQRDTPEGVKQWVQDGGYSYPIYLDPTLEASTIGQVMYLPTNYILDADGNTVFVSSGTLSDTEAAKIFDSLL